MIPKINDRKLDHTFSELLIAWGCGQRKMEEGNMSLIGNVTEELAMKSQSRREEGWTDNEGEN